MERTRARTERLHEIARQHRRLQRRAAETGADNVDAILVLGAAVLLHGSLEPVHASEVRRWADPEVVARLEAEHAALAEELAFLRELRRDEPESPDVAALARALLQRLRRHLELDERTLYRPLARLERLQVRERTT